MGIFDRIFGARFPPLSPQDRREVDGLVQELLEIGRSQDFLSERPIAGFTAQCHNIRARAIGARLSALGGQDLMQAVYRRVRRSLGENLASHLEYAWDGIGRWSA